MTRKSWGLAGPLVALALAAGTSFAQDPVPQKGTVERLGERLDSAGQSIKRGAQGAGDTIQQQLHRAKTSIHGMGVHSRVYGRLHWDKDLQASKIEITVNDDGSATLTGTVSDIKAKSKAVALTRDTVGVTGVLDRTTIQPATDVTPAGTTTTTKETKIETTTPAGRREIKVETSTTPAKP